MNKDKFRQLDFVEVLFVFAMACLTINYVVKYYVSQNFNAIYLYFFSVLIILLGIYRCRGRMSFRNKYELIYLGVYLICLTNTFIHWWSVNAQAGKFDNILIYSAVLVAFLFKDVDIRIIRKLLFYTGIIAIILFLIVLSKTSINIVSAIGRGYQWTEIFYYAPSFSLAPALLLYSIIENDKIWLGVTVIAADIILNLIIVKRMILLQVATLLFVIIVIFLLKRNQFKAYWKLIFAVFVLFSFVWIYFGNTLYSLFDSVFNRTIVYTNREELAEFNRFFETQVYFENCSIVEILFGRGFSGSHTSLGISASALHVGWTNFILKGGVLLFVISLVPCINCLRLLFDFQNLSTKKQFTIVYLLYMIPILFLSNMHGFEPSMFMFYYCCLEVMHKDKSLTY